MVTAGENVNNSPPTILVVDDERAVRALAVAILERGGYAILSAESAEEALDLAARHDGPIDLLLTDVVMPGIHGRELAERLHLLRPECRVIFMSGYSRDILPLDLPADDHVVLLEKPFTRSALLEHVEHELGIHATP
jgi:two-component system, cell cycle sensor histidine kinase and response regulator CckA